MNDEHLIKTPPTKDQIAERANLMSGVFKQLITLNASAIGLIVVFAEHFATEHQLSKILLAFAPIAFLASLFCSMMMLFTMTYRQLPGDEMTHQLDRDETTALFVSIMGFTTGIICLVLPAWFRFTDMLPQWILALVGVGFLAYCGNYLFKKIGQMRKATGES